MAFGLRGRIETNFELARLHQELSSDRIEAARFFFRR
jgi:hypothetical protein